MRVFKHFSTTIKYVLNHISEQFNARVIQKAQARMVERVTVIPQRREVGIKRLNLPNSQAAKILDGASIPAAAPVVIPTIRHRQAKRRGARARPFMHALAAPMVSGFLMTCPWSLRLVTDSCVCDQR